MYTASLHGGEIQWEVITTIHFPHWRSTHTKYGSYDHNPLPPLEVYTHQIWKLRPRPTSPIGGLHTPNMEVMTTTYFPHWRSTHTKYGSYDHNILPPLEVYTHQMWKLRPQHTSPIGGLHTPNMEIMTATHFPHWRSTQNEYGRRDDEQCTHDIPFTGT